MDKKTKLLLAAVVFLTSWVNLYALNTREIDVIRKKDVLQPQDQQIIASFLQQAINEMFVTEDFTAISATRQAIVSRKDSLNENSRMQYKKAFNSAIADILKGAFGRLDDIDDSEKVKLNLMLLIDELQTLELVPISIDNFDDDNVGVRYLAIKSVSGPEIVKALNLNTSESVSMAGDILDKFSSILDDKIDGNIMNCIVDFVSGIESDKSRQLLLKIAEQRISQYEQWSVKNEAVDQKIITALGEKSLKAIDRQDKNQLIAAMAQLYSYAIQRYALAADDLSDNQKDQLVDVIVGVENGIISDMLEANTQNLKKAIERRDMSALISSHDSLLGSGGGKGMLAGAIDFYYSTDGEDRVYSPEKLPTKPE